MLLNCGVGEGSWESLGLQGDPTSPFWRRSVLSVHWKDWCWSWNSNTLATWCKELTHLKRPWCWERLKAEGEGDNRGWDGWMVSLTQWRWVWVDSGSWWWTGRPGMLWSMGSRRVGHDWATELNWNQTHTLQEKNTPGWYTSLTLVYNLQQNTSKLIPTIDDQMWFSWGLLDWFNILKINAIHFVNGIKEKNSYDHLNRCKKKLLTKFINHLWKRKNSANKD